MTLPEQVFQFNSLLTGGSCVRSHSRMLISSPPEANILLSRLNARQRILTECPVRLWPLIFPVVISHRRTMVPPAPAKSFPSGLKAMLDTPLGKVDGS